MLTPRRNRCGQLLQTLLAICLITPNVERLDNCHAGEFVSESEIQSRASGYFRIEKINGRWMFITPDGEGYLALGANHVGKYLDTQAQSMGIFDRVGGDRPKAAEFLISEMRTLGLTAGEAYAPIADELKPHLPWIANFKFGTKSKFAFDVFDPDVQTTIRDSVINQCVEIRDDPMVLGIAFADLPVWDHRRVEFYEDLQEDAPGARVLKQHRDEGGSNDAFLGHVADTLYKILSEACRRAAPNHLFLGERHRLRGTPDSVLRSVGKHVDVFCTQALILSPQRPPEWQVFQRERYVYEHNLTGKPMLIVDWAAPFSLEKTLQTPRGTLENEEAAALRAAQWLKDCMREPFIIGVFKCQLIGLHGNDRWFDGKARRTYLKDDGERFQHRTEITRQAHADALRQAFSAALDRAEPIGGSQETTKGPKTSR